MKKLNKIILSGIVALLMSCSEEAVLPDIADEGATTEPSSVANLTDEQKAILAKSLISLTDPSVADSLRTMFDSLNASFGSDVNKIYFDYINTLPWSVKNLRVYHHPSKDKRKVCDIVTYSKENGIDRNGVFLATSYDDDHECAHDFDPNGKCKSKEAEEDYFYNFPNENILTTKIVDVDGDSVVITTVGSRKRIDDFWGYGVSCGEMLKQFKHSCDSLNGLLWDFDNGCQRNHLDLVCASFIPEGQAWFDVLNTYTEKYEKHCVDDSINYAPYDDENYVRINPFTNQAYLDSMNRTALFNKKWDSTIVRSMNAYRWQFSIIDGSVSIGKNGNVNYVEYNDPEIDINWGLAYNTLPDIPIAEEYRKEGVYVLPDSLVTTFFPKLAEYSTGLDVFKDSHGPKISIFYLVVLNDVGAKGHLITYASENGIYVTDIVKRGDSCPEDTTVYYPIILLADSPDWNILNSPIVKRTYKSANWNCDKPKTLEKIEPYGEWVASGLYKYTDYVKLFGKD